MDVKTVRGFVGNKLSFADVSAEEGLKMAASMAAEDIIAIIDASGLRGRGGAGFPSGKKWELARGQEGSPKYIIGNADEGEPGTFKDRLIMIDYPDLLFAGMTIAAIAIGAEKGMLYLRAEYAWMREHLEGVLARRRSAKLLGPDALGRKGFNFDITIRMGSGAYICGEETALIESLEGRRGDARNRVPFPVQAGYLGKPTVVNNVETLAWVPCIIQKGPSWFASMGTRKAPGAWLFSVSGDCKRPGVYEYPFGTSLRQILVDAGAEDAKGVQVGGASGICVPPEQFDRTLTPGDLATGGSIIVFGPKQDMFAVAENFQHFFADESCGQCIPCRVGNVRLLEAIHRMRKEGLDEDTEHTLRQLAKTMQVASKCGLGQSSPKAFLSILDKFAGELPARSA
ncbi:MAG TPA: NADH-ubiquinone oxidoreductase-F iron-sulfur binding region domain-containing protein [Rhizomicrobium sp.]